MKYTNFFTENFKCNFSQFKAFYFDEQSEIDKLNFLNSLLPVYSETSLDERSDYLSSFPIVIIPKSTVLCHQTDTDKLLMKETTLFSRKKKEELIIVKPSNFLWHQEYFPGTITSGGAWFTLECTYGDLTHADLKYELLDDIKLIYIPAGYKDLFFEKNEKYFNIEDLDKLNDERNLMKAVNETIDSTKFLGNDVAISRLKKISQFFNLHNNTILQKIKECSSQQDFCEILQLVEENQKQKNKEKNYTGKIDFDEMKKEHDHQNKKEHNHPHFTQDEIDEIHANMKKHKKLERLFNMAIYYDSSHLFPGVENWRQKGYSEINHPPVMEGGLLSKIQSLGFDGYISSDLCELALAMSTIKRVITRPKMRIPHVIDSNTSEVIKLIEDITNEKIQKSPKLKLKWDVNYEYNYESQEKDNYFAKYESFFTKSQKNNFSLKERSEFIFEMNRKLQLKVNEISLPIKKKIIKNKNLILDEDFFK